MKEVEKTEEPTVQMATIPVEVLNAALEYLGGQPFARVAGLIEAIKENTKVN